MGRDGCLFGNLADVEECQHRARRVFSILPHPRVRARERVAPGADSRLANRIGAISAHVPAACKLSAGSPSKLLRYRGARKGSRTVLAQKVLYDRWLANFSHPNESSSIICIPLEGAVKATHFACASLHRSDKLRKCAPGFRARSRPTCGQRTKFLPDDTSWRGGARAGGAFCGRARRHQVVTLRSNYAWKVMHARRHLRPRSGPGVEPGPQLACTLGIPSKHLSPSIITGWGRRPEGHALSFQILLQYYAVLPESARNIIWGQEGANRARLPSVWHAVCLCVYLLLRLVTASRGPSLHLDEMWHACAPGRAPIAIARTHAYLGNAASGAGSSSIRIFQLMRACAAARKLKKDLLEACAAATREPFSHE